MPPWIGKTASSAPPPPPPHLRRGVQRAVLSVAPERVLSVSLWCVVRRNAIFSMVGVLPTLQQMNNLQVSEMRDGGYGYVAAFFAPLAMEMAALVLMVIAALVPIYSILDLPWSTFGPVVGLSGLALFVFESFTGIFAFAPSVALGAAGWMIGAFAMFFPLFTLEANVVWPFRIISVISPMRYFSNSYFYSVMTETGPFSGAELDATDPDGYKCQNTWIQCFGVTGQQVLESSLRLGFMPERTAYNEVGRDVGILIAWIAAFKLIALVLLRNAVMPAIPGQPQKDKVMEGEAALLGKASKRDRQPLMTFGSKGTEAKKVFDFVHCSYDIKIKGGVKRVLDKVTGSAESGRMLAIIGPSGGGKTTLLNMIQMKQGPGTPSGRLTLNGNPFTSAMYQTHAASVDQGATVWPMLTAREQLTFACELVRPGLGALALADLVDELLEGFGLLEVQNTKAGSGLSGGELRRLAVASGLVKRPSLLFLDEPTSGLDSAAAAGVMNVISKLAMSANTAVVCVIHQPTEAIFNQFDNVLLLSCGRVAYSGLASGVKHYFKSIGKPFPTGMSSSEAALNIINRDFASDPSEVDKVLDLWAAKNATPPKPTVSSQLSTPPRTANMIEQLTTLTKRGVVNFMRDSSNWVGRLVIHSTIQLLLAAFITGGDLGQNQIQITNGGIILMFMLVSMVPAIHIPFYHAEMSLTTMEVREGKVAPFAYVLVSTAVQLPVLVACSALAMVIYYGCLFGSGPWANFGETVGLFAVFLFVYESLAQAFSTVGVIGGMIMYSGLVDQGNTFNGVFVPIEETEWPFKIASYITPSRQVMTSFVYLQCATPLCLGLSPGSNPSPAFRLAPSTASPHSSVFELRTSPTLTPLRVVAEPWESASADRLVLGLCALPPPPTHSAGTLRRATTTARSSVVQLIRIRTASPDHPSIARAVTLASAVPPRRF